jgi:aubergine-like protein
LKDKKQPLLISFTKKTKPDGKRECIGLVPELCRLTGVTEEMRTNFRLMRAVSDYTRLDPKERIRKLNSYNSRLMRSQDSVNIFEEWGLEMDRKIMDIRARVLNPETIIFGGDVRVETNLEADWVSLIFNYLCKFFRG